MYINGKMTAIVAGSVVLLGGAGAASYAAVNSGNSTPAPQTIVVPPVASPSQAAKPKPKPKPSTPPATTPPTVIVVPQPVQAQQSQRQQVRVVVNNQVIISYKVFYNNRWYILTGPNTYIGTIVPPYFPMHHRYRYHPLYVQPQPRGNRVPAPPRYHQPPASTTPTSPTPSQTPTHTPTQTPTQTPPSTPPSTPPTTQAPTQVPTQPVPPPSTPAASGPFMDLTTLDQSVASQQQSALSDAGSSDFNYTGSGTVTVTVTCTADGSLTYDCTATDGVGDTGTGDVITVSSDGTSWTDTGMTWTGPDVPAMGGFVTPASQS